MRTLLCLFLAVVSLHARQPNVILIMADDLGYPAIGVDGGESAPTPNLDRLAREGVRFDACHVQPLCTPTRVALMTGLVNKRNYTHFGHMDPAQVTFGNAFKQAGYATGITGKWQLGHDMALPAKWGFDEYCLWQLTRRPSRYKNAGLEINGKEVDFTQGEYGPDIVNDYACEFITKHKEKPFFLYYPMMLTHSPYDPTPDSADYAEKPSKGKGKGKDDAGQRFADMVAYMDKLIGKLDARLAESGIRDNTLLVFLGDNGTGNGTPMRVRGTTVLGAKGRTDEFGTHVPLIVSWPGTAKTGHVCGDIIDVTDFFPTLCAAAGLEAPKTDGRSFLPQIRGEAGTPREWRYTWYNPSGGPEAKAEWAQNLRFKLYADGSMFDTQADPKEKTPLNFETAPAEAKAARTQLAAAIASFADTRPESIARQGQAFGGEDEPKKKKKAGK